MERAHAELGHGSFENNGQVALQLLGGTIAMEDCIADGHTTIGVFVDPAASFSEVRTKCTGRGQKDIHQNQDRSVGGNDLNTWRFEEK